MAEAPRGVLTHHYKVNESGAIVWANLIIATGHNNLSIGRSIRQVSRHYIDGKRITDGMLNRVQAVLRAYDPCLSCSTHAGGQYPVELQLLDADGTMLDSVRALVPGCSSTSCRTVATTSGSTPATAADSPSPSSNEPAPTLTTNASGVRP